MTCGRHACSRDTTGQAKGSRSRRCSMHDGQCIARMCGCASKPFPGSGRGVMRTELSSTNPAARVDPILLTPRIAWSNSAHPASFRLGDHICGRNALTEFWRRNAFNHVRSRYFGRVGLVKPRLAQRRNFPEVSSVDPAIGQEKAKNRPRHRQPPGSDLSQYIRGACVLVKVEQ